MDTSVENGITIHVENELTPIKFISKKALTQGDKYAPRNANLGTIGKKMDCAFDRCCYKCK